MKQHAVLFLFLMLFSSSHASHIVGGEIYYDYLGGNQYRVYVVIYRDGLSAGAAFDNPLPLGVFFGNGTDYMNESIPFPGYDVLPVNFNNPCVTAPANIETQRAIYTKVITLPPHPDGYILAYQRCCRGPNINNLVNPEGTGLTLTVRIPGSANNNYQNSSARFTNYPPLLLCNNEPLVFDHSANDPDGDQLIYSLATPHAGASANNPAPNPIPNPAYPYINWSGGHSENNPLGPGATITIDPNTGELNADPNLIGRYVVGIRIQEYRNGTLINTTVRDFIFQVFNCNIALEAIVPEQEDMAYFVGYCNDLTVEFDNDSYGATDYEWDFGVEGSTTDVSSEYEPIFTYPDTGTYEVTLVANPGWPCTDTSFIEIKVYNELNTSYTSNDSVCFVGNAFYFDGSSDGPDHTAYSWDFGNNGEPSTAEGEDQNNIHFTSDGYQTATLQANYGVCEANYTDSVYVIPEPIADFDMPFDYQCTGLTVNFVNHTENAASYDWDFGYNDAGSNLEQPSFSYPTGGEYTAQLIATGEDPTCRDTIEKTLTVFELMTVQFEEAEDQCIVNNIYDFEGEVTGPDIATFSWDFGEHAFSSTVNDTSATDVVFLEPGDHVITFTGTFNECTAVQVDTIHIFDNPQIGFSLVQEKQCVPYTAQFENNSQAETPIYYNWDFGDGTFSSEEHPSHTYENTGTFPVTLTIWTDAGCIDTLTLTQADMIDVSPIPEAGFQFSDSVVNECEGSITFFNTSSNASTYYYSFDDSTFSSMEVSPSHTYYEGGTYYPTLIAENDEGCKDTISKQLIVEPVIIFIPNTFTPDGNEHNNSFHPETWIEPEYWNMKIYNRWGELVFVTSNFNVGWDGTCKGKKAQDGLYTYVVEYSSCSKQQETVQKRGFVNLMR